MRSRLADLMSLVLGVYGCVGPLFADEDTFLSVSRGDDISLLYIGVLPYPNHATVDYEPFASFL